MTDRKPSRAVADIFRTVECLDYSTSVAERREKLRNAVTRHTSGLDRDELVELIYGLAGMLERFNYR
jgi:hypothetical protein